MSITTLTGKTGIEADVCPNRSSASRILKGQLQGRAGEDESLFFETFPHVSLLKVSCTYQFTKKEQFMKINPN